MFKDFLGRYEYRDAKSNKFWSVKRISSGFEVRWGPIGSSGQSMTYDEFSEAEVRAKVTEKLRKGYVKIEDSKGYELKLKPEYVAEEKAKTLAAKKLMAEIKSLDKTELSARDRLKAAAAKVKPKTVHIETEGEKKGTEYYKATDTVSAEGVELVHPSRCTADLPEDLTAEHLVAEPKMDGSRYVMYFGCSPYNEGENALLSRRNSVTDGKYVDKTANVPHLFNEDSISDLKGTVLDGEIQAEDFLSTNSIMNSGPRLAVQKQEESGWVNYYAFDIIYYCGTDVRRKPLSERRKILEYVVTVLNNPNIKAIEQFTVKDKDFNEYFNQITSDGGEGLIIKDVRRAYGTGWAKMKKSYDISCIVTGFKAGNGKYKTSVGSIALSVYADDGELVEVGFASGFDDATRADMAKNPDKYLNRVVDVFAQEIQDSKKSKSKVGRLRHPTFHRFRDDLNVGHATASKMWEDFKKVKSERAKKFER